MKDESKILTLSLTAAAAAAAVPAVIGVLKNLRPQPLASCDRLHAENAGFADANGDPVALHAVALPDAPAAFLRDGEDCPPEEAEQAARLLREAMEGAMELRVPLVAEVHQGKNWAEAK